MRANLSYLLVCIYLLTQVGLSHSVAQVVIRLSEFNNHAGTDEQGQPCTGGTCNHFLHFCITESSNGTCVSNVKTIRGPWRSNSFSASDIEVNTVAFDIDSYQGAVSLMLTATHGIGGAQVAVDTFWWSFKEPLLALGPASQTLVLHGQRNQTASSVTVEVSVSCATNFYPPQCDIYCAEGQTCDGHYSCKSSGERACDDGWTGTGCNTTIDNEKFDCDVYRVVSVGLYEGWYTCTDGNMSLGINITSVSLPEHTADYQLKAETYYTSEAHTLDGEIIATFDTPVISLYTPAVRFISLYSFDGSIYNRTIITGRTSTNNRECGRFSLTRVKVLFNGCHNGGRCSFDPIKGRDTCCCPLGWMGDTCQQVDRCHQNACLNGGRCQQHDDTRTCQCMPGYTGDNCESRMGTVPSQYKISYDNSAIWMLVELVSYDNPLGTDYLNTCCLDEHQEYRTCHCNHRFDVCLDDTQNTNQRCSAPYQLLDGPSYVNSFNGTDMHVKRALFALDTWTPTLRVYTRVVHWRNNRDILVDRFIWPADQDDLDADYGSAQWRSIHQTGQRTDNPTSLAFRVKIYCGKDYFGSNCTVYCLETDDDTGHFSCDKNGSKICYDGWTGNRCEMPLTSTTITSEDTTELTAQSSTDANATDVFSTGSSTSTESSTDSTTIPIPEYNITSPPVISNRSDITCNDDNFEIFIPLNIAGGDFFSFRDPSCQPWSNGSHIIGRFSLSSCGTTVHFTNTSLIYRNELTKMNASGPLVSEGVIGLECVYPRTRHLLTSYTPVQRHVLFYERNSGVIDMQMRQYHSSSYSKPYRDSDYPVEVIMDDRIYMEITASPNRSDSVSNLGLFPALCIATHTVSPRDSVFKTLIKDACPADQSVTVHIRPRAGSWRFSFDAFEFSQHKGSTVYVHCEVRMCNANDSHCASPSCSSTRGKRSADDTERQDGHFVSGGPFVLSKDAPASGHAFPYSFAAISLLVAIVAVTIAVIVVRRRPKS